MNSNDQQFSPDEEEPLNELIEMIDLHWEALRSGEGIQPDSWRKLYPNRHKIPSELLVVGALFDATCAINEDSIVPAEPDQDLLNGDNKLENLQASTKLYISRSADPGVEFREGDKIGKFEIKETLGRGGQAITYKAWDPDTERTVVVKAYHGAISPRLQEAVVLEGQKLTRVRSPYVIECYHVERMNGVPYLVLEYVPGQSLAELQTRAPLLLSESLKVIAGVAKGLADIHARGLLHRDIKPGNIVIGHNGIPKLLDFGLAKALGDADLGIVSGTFSYMPPEQALGDMDRVDQRTDVFGLGATLYFLLTGHAPYEGTFEEVRRAAREGKIAPPKQRNPAVPADVNRFCMRCLAKAPENRFESALQLAKVIEHRWLYQFRKTATAAVVFLAVVGIIAIRFRPNETSNSRQNDVSAVSSGVALAPTALAGPIKIESVEFLQFVRNDANEHDVQGVVLRDPYRLRFGDGVHFRAKLSRPAYCFWLAFRPDGVEELCFPDNPDESPPLTDTPKYPPVNQERVAYGLTDALGAQAFVLVLSPTPLPSYNEWRKALPSCPWPPTGNFDIAIRHHDGNREDAFPPEQTQTTRGRNEPLLGSKYMLADLVVWLRGDNEHPPTIDAWVLPVIPREIRGRLPAAEGQTKGLSAHPNAPRPDKEKLDTAKQRHE